MVFKNLQRARDAWSGIRSEVWYVAVRIKRKLRVAELDERTPQRRVITRSVELYSPIAKRNEVVLWYDATRFGESVQLILGKT